MGRIELILSEALLYQLTMINNVKEPLIDPSYPQMKLNYVFTQGDRVDKLMVGVINVLKSNRIIPKV